MTIKLRRRSFLQSTLGAAATAVTKATPGINLLENIAPNNFTRAELVQKMVRHVEIMDAVSHHMDYVKMGMWMNAPCPSDEMYAEEKEISAFFDGLKKAGYPGIDQIYQEAVQQFWNLRDVAAVNTVSSIGDVIEQGDDVLISAEEQASINTASRTAGVFKKAGEFLSAEEGKPLDAEEPQLIDEPIAVEEPTVSSPPALPVLAL